MKCLIVSIIFLFIFQLVTGAPNSNTDLNVPKISKLSHSQDAKSDTIVLSNWINSLDKNKFALEYLNYYKTGVRSPYLKNALKYVKFPREARMKEADDISPENQVKKFK